MNYGDLLREVADDWFAARDSKQQLEERRIRDYKLFRRFREDVKGSSFEEAVAGPFGWSKLTVPIIFWIVETIVPRVATQPPTLVVKPLTAEAVPYAQAKELELQDTLQQMNVRSTMHRTLKQMVLYGDGPTKVTWNGINRRPRLTDISWFDWFLSPGARTPDTAEVIHHRAWYTRRQLQRLSRLTDRNGKPLYHGLDQVVDGQAAEASDSTLSERLDASGQGPRSWGAEGGMFCLIESWYEDGTVVTMGGAHGDRIVQVRTSPFRDEAGQPIRPFVVFSNSYDPESPYGIGDAEMLEDHQSELSTLRNQAIDQTTVNIAAPIVYSGNVKKPDIDAAFGQPGGSLRVNGDVRQALMRVAPGNVSSDFANFYNNIREESQFISGVNDNQAGQAADRQQTATEINVINQEANRRWQYKIASVEDRFGAMGRLMDLHERRYGTPGRAIMVPKGMTIDQGQRGLMGPGGEALEPGESAGTFGRTSPFTSADGTKYAVTVKAGSLALPSELEEFQKVMTLAQALGLNPEIAATVRWQEVARLIVSTSSFDPEKLLLSQDEIAQQQMVAALQAIPTDPNAGGPAAAPAPQQPIAA